MISTISLNKINSVIKKNFRLNTASLIITNILAFLGTVMISYFAVGVKEKGASSTASVYDVTFEYIAAVAALLSVIGTVQMFFLSIKMFREIYSRRASDFFYAMPVTRLEYFSGNVIYGLVNIASVAVSVIIATLVFAKTPVLFDTAHNFVELKPFFNVIISFIVCIVYEFSGFMLSAVLCGKIWQVMAMSVISLSSCSVLISGITAYMNSIYGFYSDTTRSQHGLGGIVTLFNGGNEAESWISAVLYIAAAVIVFIFGYLVFKNRKAEAAEQSLSGRIMPYIILFVVCAGTYISFSTFDERLHFEILIGIAAVIITAAVFCAVFYKKVFTKGAAVAAAAVCIVMSAFLLGVDKLPEKTGYIDYVPEAEEVQSVKYEISGDNYQYAGNGVTDFIDSLFYSENYYEDDNIWNISSEEGKERITALHKKAVSEEVIKKYNNYYNYGDEEFGENQYEYIDAWYSFKLTYTLKSGKTVIRCYAVDAEDIIEEYAAITQTDEVIDQRFPFEIDTQSVLFARLEENDTEAVDDFVYDELDEDAEKPDDYGIYYKEDSYFTLDNYGDFFALLRQDIKARDAFNATAQDLSYMLYYMNDKRYETQQSICVYYLSDDCPADEAERIKKMTPAQVEKYLYMNNNSYVEEQYIILNTAFDKNTVGFLQNRGILK